MVVPGPSPVGDVVHAALIPADENRDPDEMVRLANQRLETHQRIRSWSVWPEEDFPRTPLHLEGAAPPGGPADRRRARDSAPGDGLPGPRGPGPAHRPRPAADSRGPASGRGSGIVVLDRVDLLSRLEDRRGLELDEEGLARIGTVQELEATLTGPAAGPGSADARGATEPGRVPSPGPAQTALPYWTRRAPVRWARTGLREGVMVPLLRNRLPLTVTGADLLSGSALQ